MNRVKVASAVLLMVMFSLAIAGSASAYTKTVTYVDYVSPSDAVGRVDVNDLSSTKWEGKIRSNMEGPATPINIIGRTWWTVRELCEVTWTQNFQYQGQYNSGSSSYTATKQVTKVPCVGERFGRSLGAHDFDHTNRPRWQPGNDTLHVHLT